MLDGMHAIVGTWFCYVLDQKYFKQKCIPSKTVGIVVFGRKYMSVHLAERKKCSF
jgi:hypothetical protein